MIVTLAILCVASDGICGEKPASSISGSGDIVARINGAPIYDKELTLRVEKAISQYRKKGMTSPKAELVDTLKKRELEKLIDEKALIQAAEKLEIPDIDQKVSEKIEKMKTEFGSAERFQKMMAARKMTLDDVKARARVDIYINTYLKQQGLDDPVVSEDSIRNFYEQGQSGFKQDETVNVRHILLQINSDASAEEKQRVRKQAEDLREKIVSGNDFGKLARTVSNCLRSRDKGGDLGFVKRGFMPQAFDDAAFALKKGEVSQVVETAFGYHIIELMDRKPAGIIPLADVKDFISRYLKNQERQKNILNRIGELRKQATIEIYLKNS